MIRIAPATVMGCQSAVSMDHATSLCVFCLCRRCKEAEKHFVSVLAANALARKDEAFLHVWQMLGGHQTMYI